MVPRPSTGCQWLLERTLLVLPQKEMELGEGGKGVSRDYPEGVKGVARPECYIHSRHIGNTEQAGRAPRFIWSPIPNTCRY